MRIKANTPIATRIIMAIGIITVVMVMFALGRIAYASGETLSAPFDRTLYEGQNVNIDDLWVNGSGNDQVTMILSASNGSLQFGGVDGLTFNGPNSGSKVQFSGTRSDVNAALSTLRYYADEAGEHTVEATLGDGNYWAENGHVYTVVESPGISWQDAKEAAEAAQYGGVHGYLATITSQGEHDFILERINKNGWIGANDLGSEGVWRWETGPEAGDQFWTGDNEGGSAFNGAFTKWNAGEPNNSGDSEDCGQIWFTEGSSGQWNDLNCDSEENEYYVVEFGDDETLPAVTSTEFNVTVNSAPEIAYTNLIPADDSVVSPVDSVSITFNQPMGPGEGYLTIYNATDDSKVETIWVDGDTDENNTYVFELANKLQPGGYYVTISGAAMSGVADWWYDGIDSKTAWNFTIVDAATPNGGDANNDGIADSTQKNVDGYTNSYTGKYVAIDVGDSCELTAGDTSREVSFDVQDAAYEYDNGLWEFEAGCGTPGFTTTIKLYYYDVSAENMVVRKHNPVTGAYFTLPDAEITSTTIGGQNVVVVTYQITDGSDRDVDATKNGEIVDPVGLARNVVGVPNTGFGRL